MEVIHLSEENALGRLYYGLSILKEAHKRIGRIVISLEKYWNL